MGKKQLSAKDMLKTISSSLKNDDDLSTVEWMLQNKIKTEDGIPFEFTNRKFLIDFYNDESPVQVIRASAQIGKTTGMYIKLLRKNFQGWNVALSEPTMQLRDLLTKSKLHPIIENNAIFKDVVGGDMNLKRVKGKNFFLVYTFGDAAGIAFTTDIMVMDECARSNQETLNTFKSRMNNSIYKHEIYISNPNSPADILEQKWNISDQKHWAVKCDHCSKRQILNYDGLPGGTKGNVCKERKIFVCQHCDKKLETQTIIDGQWVKRFQNRDVAGYWINQLLRYDCDVNSLLADEQRSMKYFKNFVLGEPYAGSDVTVNAEVIKENLVPMNTFKAQPSGIVAGVDVGNATGHHVTLAQNGVIFKVFKVQKLSDLDNVIVDYNVEKLVIDYMPEYEGAKELQERFGEIVIRCRYLPNRNAKDETITLDAEKGLVHVAKHVQFDNIVNDFDKGKYKFAIPDGERNLDEFCDHFGALAKIEDFDTAGNMTFKWEAPDGVADHFAHSFLYMTVAQYLLDEFKPRHGTYHAEPLSGGLFMPEDEEFVDLKPKKSWLDY